VIDPQAIYNEEIARRNRLRREAGLPLVDERNTLIDAAFRQLRDGYEEIRRHHRNLYDGFVRQVVAEFPQRGTIYARTVAGERFKAKLTELGYPMPLHADAVRLVDASQRAD
jgi:spore germination protein YaaH